MHLFLFLSREREVWLLCDFDLYTAHLLWQVVEFILFCLGCEKRLHTRLRVVGIRWDSSERNFEFKTSPHIQCVWCGRQSSE